MNKRKVSEWKWKSQTWPLLLWDGTWCRLLLVTNVSEELVSPVLQCKENPTYFKCRIWKDIPVKPVIFGLIFCQFW